MPSLVFGTLFNETLLIRGNFTVANRTMLLSVPQGVALFEGKQKVVVVTDKGTCFIYDYSQLDKQWVFQASLQLSTSSRQKRCSVRSPDENCLYISGDGGGEGHGTGSIASLRWDQAQLVTDSSLEFEGVTTLAISSDGKWLAACSPMIHELRIYTSESCKVSLHWVFNSEKYNYFFRHGCYAASFSEDGNTLCASWKFDNRIACFDQVSETWRLAKVLTASIGENIIGLPGGITFLDPFLLIVHEDGAIVSCPFESMDKPIEHSEPPQYSYLEYGCRVYSNKCKKGAKKQTLYQQAGSLQRVDTDVCSSDRQLTYETESDWPELGKLDEIREYDNKTVLIAGKRGLHLVSFNNGSVYFLQTLARDQGSPDWAENRITFDPGRNQVIVASSYKCSLKILTAYDILKSSSSLPAASMIQLLITSLYAVSTLTIPTFSYGSH